MKRIVIILAVLIVAIITLFLGDDRKKNKVTDPSENERDEEMAGPRGEDIFIGSGGGRYFIKDGKRIYVGYKTKKEPAS